MAKNGETNKLHSILVGIAGEYLVAGELSRNGFIAAVTLRNAKGVDILASSGDASKSVSIQVKTARGKQRVWLVSDKADTDARDDVFYVFVNLNDGGAPSYHVVPSGHVAKVAAELYSHRRKQHKDSKMRAFRDNEGNFLDRWDLLGLEGGNGKAKKLPP